MPGKHYLLFVGPSASLSTEVVRLAGRIAGSEIVAPAMSKALVGVNNQSIERVLEQLHARVRLEGDQFETARLSIWAYGPPQPHQLDIIWKAFGRSAWIEFVPMHYMHKDRPTRMFIEDRLKSALSLMHLVSHSVYNGRKTSPLPLPLRNFRSSITEELSRFWYASLDQNDLKASIDRLRQGFHQLRSGGHNKYCDDYSNLFEPADDGVCHGQPHPTGSSPEQFIAGRFRFGVSLFKGFHYEVSSSKHATLKSTLADGNQGGRNMALERRKYINIFPNDHLLPAK